MLVIAFVCNLVMFSMDTNSLKFEKILTKVLGSISSSNTTLVIFDFPSSFNPTYDIWSTLVTPIPPFAGFVLVKCIVLPLVSRYHHIQGAVEKKPG